MSGDAAHENQGVWDRPPGENETVVTGTVAFVNERGVKLEGRLTWLNTSKYSRPLPADLSPGDQVEVRASPTREPRWINALRVVRQGAPGA